MTDADDRVSTCSVEDRFGRTMGRFPAPQMNAEPDGFQHWALALCAVPDHSRGMGRSHLAARCPVLQLGVTARGKSLGEGIQCRDVLAHSLDSLEAPSCNPKSPNGSDSMIR
jgi:hypothetical protein